MNSVFQSQEDGMPCPVGWRKSGVDFDREGKKSTLQELLQLGGYFPLSRIDDRLPFPVATVRRWSRSKEFASCIVPVHIDVNEPPILTLIDLNRLDDCLRAIAEL